MFPKEEARRECERHPVVNRDRLLLVGPPASGKTRRVLEALCSGGGANLLLVPTATMAQHLRHQLVREGVPLRPGCIRTLSRFVAELTPDFQSAAALPLIVNQGVQHMQAQEFEAVSRFPGFHAALSSLIEELSAAGCEPGDLAGLRARYANPVQRVFANVEQRLKRRGLALPGRLLEEAARRVGTDRSPRYRRVLFDGFFFLSVRELALVEALAKHCSMTVTLPEWPGADSTRAALFRQGYTEERLGAGSSKVQSVVVAAPTITAETEDIARRVLEFTERGYSFRDIGILVRAADPYARVLRTTLARFAIPARFYFAERLADHPACRFLAGALDALLDGWDHDRLMAILQLPVSGIAATAAGDRLDFAMRKQIPGSGLSNAPDGPASVLFDKLRSLEYWRTLSLPPQKWSERFQSLRDLFPHPQPEDGVSHERLAVWRAQECALDAFRIAVEDAAAALDGDASLTLADFWEAACDVVNRAPLRVPDPRRDVTHVMDVYEARQWRLPVVFLCGLLERQFPQYPRQNPLLGDAARIELRGLGIALPTTADREQEERFLFRLAAGRATDHLVLSYPQYNDKGEESLASFYLREFRDERQPVEQASRPVRPAPARNRGARREAAITDTGLREFLAQLHARLSPSSIESYMQCPFQFFARRSLGLRGAPAKPEDRLDLLLQGRIVHDTLAELMRTGHPVRPVFDAIFRAACRKENVPDSYRTEAVRLELLRHLSAFADDRGVALPWISRLEEPFEFPLENGPAIRGRTDRVDIGPSGEALVIDYKHSGVQNLKQRVKSTADGEQVQAGLYLLAVERSLGLRPMGMLFCGLRKGVNWEGWHISIPGLDVGERCGPAMIKELMDKAAENSRKAHASILSGRVAPEPSDTDKCRYCESRDICRVEVAHDQAEAVHLGSPDSAWSG